MDVRRNIINFEHNFCVTAGAGAGKTTCLKDAYLGLLASGLSPSQIVAITFTEKAAEEMRSRVVQAVAQKAQDTAEQAWRSLLPQVEWAPLTTIHSFCATILREFGVLLGLDPNFVVADEVEFSSLLDELIQDILRDSLRRGDASAQRLFAHHPKKAGQLLKQVYQALRNDGISPAQAKTATREAHDKALADGALLLDQIAEGMTELARISAEKGISKEKGYGRNIHLLLDRWPHLERLLRSDPVNQDLVSEMEQLTRGNWYAAKPARDIIRPAVEQLLANTTIPLASQLSDDLLNLVEQLSIHAEQECRRRSWLSFDDLLLSALDLLQRHPQVLAELRSRWQVLMVDEFQDVNPVQGELVRLLAGLNEAEPADTPPKLMVVGDRKQSIYAFRGADVTVITQTMAEFPGLGGEVAALKENFRSKPELIEFFNRLFENVFRDTDLSGRAPLAFVEFSEHDTQVSGREHPEPGHSLVELVEVANASPAAEDKVLSSAWRQWEAEALVSYILSLINHEGVSPGAIAVLFRRLTKIETYEDKLRAAGIDFYTFRGRGFYECQEIKDLLLALSALLNPRDQLAMYGFLRSPMVGLSDEALLALCYPDGPTYRDLAKAVRDAADLPEWLGQEQSLRWRKALGLFQKIGPLASRMSPAELIEWVLDATGIIAVLMATPSGEQKVANLRKVLETAREPKGNFAGGAEGFVRGLKAMVEQTPTDPQAPLLGEDAQVVRLMSVHQAKGLEFPVVILPDLDAGRRGGDSLPPPRDGVVGLKPRDPLTNKLMPTPVSQFLAEYQAAVEEAESMRLFYVACTRAQERLAFLQTHAQREMNHPKGWVKWVEEFVRPDPLTRVITSEELGPPPAMGGQGIAMDWPDLVPPEPGAKDAEGAALVKRVLEPELLAPVQNRVVRISVSGLENWFACPRLSMFTRLYGLDTAALPQRGARHSDASPPSSLDPAALGSAVHLLLESCDLSAGPAGLEPALAALDPSLAAAVRPLASGVWDTDLVQLIEGLPSTHFLREQPFRLWLPPTSGTPGVEVIGELDLLIVRPDPEPPVIVDYKVTPHIDPEHYRDQLALYALALWSADPDSPPPRTCLCYLREAGAKLIELKFSAGELAAYRARVIQAGADMAALKPDVKPTDLPRGEGCAECALAGHGLCPEAA
jgi:ATP-dependent helicase/nuclease subunit A